MTGPAEVEDGPSPASPAGDVSPKLLESLVCPATGGKLGYDGARGELVSKAAGLAYPIRSGIPIMLIDEARKLEE
ncbi:Trm112 family protein [Limibaculum sp. FT325]|uniref:Trm112 family protein n=1 Tax=Thermohalobaculum sediminis TaxID=2939436 RepID=UPI0020BED4B8|nr:Trm112 family protein [Limibaculum sediminis]MCL5777058.1 Trm112 family protein [Limibaculum sediminis]